MFDSGRRDMTPVKDLTRRSSPHAPVREEAPIVAEETVPEPQESPYESVENESTQEEALQVSSHVKEKSSLLSPLGNLGSEELLLLALALIIFQGGKEPDLALILLALLFIN